MGFEDDADDYDGDKKGKVWAAKWERVEDYTQAQKILDQVFPLGEDEKRKALANLCLAYSIEKNVRPSDLELVTYRDPKSLEVGYRFRLRKDPEDQNDTSEDQDFDDGEDCH
jgi:hypothetical protein